MPVEPGPGPLTRLAIMTAGFPGLFVSRFCGFLPEQMSRFRGNVHRWLLAGFCHRGKLNRMLPSASACTPKPPSCTSRWCRRQSRTRLSIRVSPPSAQCLMWWASTNLLAGTARETAAAIPAFQGTPNGGWNGAGFAADVERLAVFALMPVNHRCIAGHPPGRFRGNVAAAFAF